MDTKPRQRRTLSAEQRLAILECAGAPPQPLSDDEVDALILLAGSGSMDARRKLADLALWELLEPVPSMRLTHWLFWSLGDLLAAQDAPEGGSNSIATLQVFGRERRAPGRPTDDDVDFAVEVAGTIEILAGSMTKSAAVRAVATAIPKSESAVWAMCKKTSKVRGLSMVKWPLLDRVKQAAGINPHDYSKELHEFFAVTPES